MSAEISMMPAGRCPVCGQALAPEPWRCSVCETPHHADCAEYFGGCAIFGCRDGRLPDRLEVATWPTATQNLQHFLLIRRMQWASLFGFGVSWGLGMFVVNGIAGVLQYSTVSGPVFKMCLSLDCLGLFGFGPAFIIASLLARRSRQQLERALGASRADALELPGFRLRSVLAHVHRGDRSARWVQGIGWVSLLLSVGVIYVDSLSMWPIFIPALLILMSGRVLSGYQRENRAIVHRFEASFAPQLPEKPKLTDDQCG
jgi:hypothetical protein